MFPQLSLALTSRLAVRPCCPCLQGTIEKQVLSTVASPPRVRFGTGKRPGMAEKTDAPGPGAYRVKAVIGGWQSQFLGGTGGRAGSESGAGRGRMAGVGWAGQYRRSCGGN